MIKKRLTVDDIMGWVKCSDWTLDRVKKKFGDRKSVTPLQLARARGIESEDKLWILLRPEIIPEKELHLLGCDIAESVLHIFEAKYPGDKRPRKAIEAKRLWVTGKISDEKLAATRAAAWAAAWPAARDAARDARDAARAAAGAAWPAAWDAARDAAWAARAAAGDAARDAAKDKYLRMTTKVLNRN